MSWEDFRSISFLLQQSMDHRHQPSSSSLIFDNRSHPSVGMFVRRKNGLNMYIKRNQWSIKDRHFFNRWIFNSFCFAFSKRTNKILDISDGKKKKKEYTIRHSKSRISYCFGTLDEAVLEDRKRVHPSRQRMTCSRRTNFEFTLAFNIPNWTLVLETIQTSWVATAAIAIFPSWKMSSSFHIKIILSNLPPHRVESYSNHLNRHDSVEGLL